MGKKSENKLVSSGEKKPKKNSGHAPQTNTLLTSSKEDKLVISKIMNELMIAYKQTRVTCDEEYAQRLDEYFLYCANNGIVPTIEEMCLFVGYSRKTLWDWKVGKSGGLGNLTSGITQKAFETVAAFDAKLVIAGKMNVVAYIFRSKNYYEMVDKKEITHVSATEAIVDEAELERKYAASVVYEGESEEIGNEQ